MDSQNTDTQPTRGLSYLYMAAAFVIVVAGMRAAEAILNPLLLAIFLSIISAPGYFHLLNRGISSWLALLTVIGVLSVAMLSVIFFVTSSIADFTAQQEHYRERLDEERNKLVKIVEAWAPDWNSEAEPEEGDSGGRDSNGDSDESQPTETALEPANVDEAEGDAAGDPGDDKAADDNTLASNTENEGESAIDDDDSESAERYEPRVTAPQKTWSDQAWDQFNPSTALSYASKVALSVGNLSEQRISDTVDCNLHSSGGGYVSGQALKSLR